MSAIAASFSDVYSSALRGEACHVVGLSRAPRRLPVSSWNSSASPSDRVVLSACVGPTLDIGCGPGRMTECLAELGHLVLGIDLVAEAVAQTRDRGVAALQLDVFAAVPGEGRWTSALLADGNIGIGGNPGALLSRVGALLAPGGRAVVDLAAPGTGLETRTVRLRTTTFSSRPFPWSVVGIDAISPLADAAGFASVALHRDNDRWFAVLTKEAI